MLFWVLLSSAIFIMVLLYLIIGHKHLYITLIIYSVLIIGTGITVYLLDMNLYILDLLALFIPYLIIIPLDTSIKYIVKHYVLNDNSYTTNHFIAIYRRIKNVFWLMLGFLLIGLLFVFSDIFMSGFNALNIWSLSVTSALLIIIVILLVSVKLKKTFAYVIIVKKNKDYKVYRIISHKGKLKTNSILNADIKVYPRGIINDQDEMVYLYYIKDAFNVDNSLLEEYNSELFEYLKDDIEDYELLESKYNEYIDKKTSH